MSFVQRTTLFLPLSIVFFATTIVEIFADLQEFTWLKYSTKPLLMIWLMILLFINGYKEGGKFSKGIMFALFFSFWGDFFLMFNDDYFIFGLGSFLIAHLAYIYAFIANSRENNITTGKIIGNFILLIPFIIFLSKFLGYLKPNIVNNPETADFWIPVMVYGSVISFMGYVAAIRINIVEKASFWTIMLGALLFLVSDSTIAINKFVQEIPYAPLWIMSTYTLAQYLIVTGSIIHIKKSADLA